MRALNNLESIHKALPATLMILMLAQIGFLANRIGALAGQVMRLVEALVKESDIQISDSASILNKIVTAAADENGEWHLPLSDSNVSAMKAVGHRLLLKSCCNCCGDDNEEIQSRE